MNVVVGKVCEMECVIAGLLVDVVLGVGAQGGLADGRVEGDHTHTPILVTPREEGGVVALLVLVVGETHDGAWELLDARTQLKLVVVGVAKEVKVEIGGCQGDELLVGQHLCHGDPTGEVEALGGEVLEVEGVA